MLVVLRSEFLNGMSMYFTDLGSGHLKNTLVLIVSAWQNFLKGNYNVHISDKYT